MVPRESEKHKRDAWFLLSNALISTHWAIRRVKLEKNLLKNPKNLKNTKTIWWPLYSIERRANRTWFHQKRTRFWVSFFAWKTSSFSLTEVWFWFRSSNTSDRGKDQAPWHNMKTNWLTASKIRLDSKSANQLESLFFLVLLMVSAMKLNGFEKLTKKLWQRFLRVNSCIQSYLLVFIRKLLYKKLIKRNIYNMKLKPRKVILHLKSGDQTTKSNNQMGNLQERTKKS